ncbi:MAG: cystathionine gamma-synthase family protein [Longimicrobiales bacterium]|nr:cystathionine gamma-synthase family protein [Longimicrobiales bacterium]
MKEDSTADESAPGEPGPGEDAASGKRADAPAGWGTRAVWAGEEWSEDHPPPPGSPTQVPVVHSVSFGYRDPDTWAEVARGERPGHIYGRNTNPTVAVFEEKVRQLEGAEAATSFSTGMAAISGLLWALLEPGERVVSVRDTYGGTSRVLSEHLPRFGVDTVLCPTDDPEAIEAEIEGGCDILYLETPTNPTLAVLDLARLSAAARKVGATVVVDNTFATPVNQSPLDLGAHLVVHSATKFLGGHADALGGVVCGSEELVDGIFQFREIQGSSLHPEAAYLLIRGLKTLHLRVRRQNESALRIARWLEGRSDVGAVHYPGLESHPMHDVARRQMRGFGGVLSFSLAGGEEAVARFLPRLRWAHRAANLGAVETVVGTPATTSHVECTAEERAALGIPEGLIRYSVGIEDPDDLMADLESALEAAGPA